MSFLDDESESELAQFFSKPASAHRPQCKRMFFRPKTGKRERQCRYPAEPGRLWCARCLAAARRSSSHRRDKFQLMGLTRRGTPVRSPEEMAQMRSAAAKRRELLKATRALGVKLENLIHQFQIQGEIHAAGESR